MSDGSSVNVQMTDKQVTSDPVQRRVSEMVGGCRVPLPRRRAVVVASVLTSAGLLGACKEEVQFTRTPALGEIERAGKPTETTLFAAVPIDTTQVTAAAEAALVGIRSKDYVDDIACDRRSTGWVECNGGVVTTDLQRNGPVTIATENGRLMLTVPMKYEVYGKGLGWAAYLADRKVGNVTAKFPIEVALAPGFKLAIKLGAESVWSERTVPLMKGKSSLIQAGDGKIKAQLKAAVDGVRGSLSEAVVRDAGDRAWRALAQPIALMDNVWMRAQPDRLGGAGFTTDTSGAVLFRLGIVAKVSMHRGERPAPLFANKAMPDVSRGGATAAETELRVPVDIGAAALQTAVSALFPKSERIETRADQRSSPLIVSAASATLRPARDKVALELQLDVLEPKRMFGMTGKAYLVGKPVLRNDGRLLELEEISFPTAPPKDVKSRTQILRIGEEPFAGRLAAAARLDLGTEIETLLPRINQRIEQRLDDALALTGKFTSYEIAGVDAVRDAFRINLALKGELVLRYGGAIMNATAFQTAGASAPEPPKKAARR